jgi:hypothetical protein
MVGVDGMVGRLGMEAPEDWAMGQARAWVAVRGQGQAVDPAKGVHRLDH